MKTAIRLFVIAFIFIITISLSACKNQREQSLEEMYNIKNCSVVYFENNSTEFYNFGNGTDEKTVYELASNGKPIAAYIALEMVNEGILDINEKIAPYLGSDLLTDDIRLNEITLYQLLCHTAGFSPNYELGTDKKIYSDPGSMFCYSGVGYIYLQNVIENASGMTIEQAAEHYVFKPLGMENSTFESVTTITPYMNFSSALLYALAFFILSFIVLLIIAYIAGKLTKFKYYSFINIFPVCFLAAGIINAIFLLFFFVSKVLLIFLICFAVMGAALFLTKKYTKLFYACIPIITSALFIFSFISSVNIPVTNDLIAKAPNCAYTFKSTSEDMAIFCEELVRKAKGSDDIFKNMFAPAVEIDENNAWGLGIAIETISGSETTYWHSGINPGFQSLFVLYPEENKYIVILTNSDSGLDFSKEMARSFLSIDGEWNIKRIF